MPKYELMLACVDEPEAHRKKEGDIVAVRPYPCNWGRKEIEQYLIVIIEVEEDIQTMRATYEIFLYEGGLDRHPSDEVEAKILAKNRFQIPLDILKDGWITDLDFSKVRDKTYTYQPFKRASQLTARFDGKEGRHLLNGADVDCISEVSMANSEFVIDTKEKVSLIWDKYRKSYKYSMRKIALGQ